MMKACSAEFTLNNLQSDEIEDKPEMMPDESKRVAFGENILLYGVPGSGKSWTIEHEYCKAGTVVER